MKKRIKQEERKRKEDKKNKRNETYKAHVEYGIFKKRLIRNRSHISFLQGADTGCGILP